jgi:malonyl-CoA O-methyltransferase
MLECLSLIKIQPQQILDAGCGEGRDLFALQQHYPAAALLGIDAAAPMLQAARSANAATRSALKVFLSNLIGKPRLESAAALLGCADFAQLPLVKPGAALAPAAASGADGVGARASHRWTADVQLLWPGHVC